MRILPMMIMPIFILGYGNSNAGEESNRADKAKQRRHLEIKPMDFGPDFDVRDLTGMSVEEARKTMDDAEKRARRKEEKKESTED